MCFILIQHNTNENLFFQSTMSDSDSDSELERADSVTSIPSDYEQVPYNIDFKVKAYSSNGDRVGKFLYTASEGKDLPYSVNVKCKETSKVTQFFEHNLNIV